jgi:hypothetical protein
MPTDSKENPAALDPDETAKGLDVIWGTRGIARAINRTKRQAYNLIATGQIPVERADGRYFTTRCALQRRFQIGEVGAEGR